MIGDEIKRTIELNINDQMAKLTSEIDDRVITYWKLDRKEIEQSLVTVRVLNDLKEWLKQEIQNIELTGSQINGHYMMMQPILDSYKYVLTKINKLEEQYKCSQ